MLLRKHRMLIVIELNFNITLFLKLVHLQIRRVKYLIVDLLEILKVLLEFVFEVSFVFGVQKLQELLLFLGWNVFLLSWLIVLLQWIQTGHLFKFDQIVLVFEEMKSTEVILKVLVFGSTSAASLRS